MPAEHTPSIHLITCVGVDTEHAHLPHFLDHYRALGIAPENIHVILNTGDAASDNLQRAQTLLAERSIAAPYLWVAPYTSGSMWQQRRALQAERVPATDWVISADVDEFHEYPVPLADFLAECDARGVNCVQGVFIDRLAADGQLAAVACDVSIWDRFPIQADVQCTIGQTGVHHDWYGTVKVMALKGGLFPSRGGHHPVASDSAVRYLFGRHLATFPRIGQSAFRFSIPLRVHHFKWTDSMPATLRQRLATPGVSPAGAEYGQKLIDYFAANDGVRMADIPVRTSNSDGHASWRHRVAYLKTLNTAYRATDNARSLASRIKGRIGRIKRRVLG